LQHAPNSKWCAPKRLSKLNLLAVVKMSRRWWFGPNEVTAEGNAGGAEAEGLWAGPGSDIYTWDVEAATQHGVVVMNTPG